MKVQYKKCRRKYWNGEEYMKILDKDHIEDKKGKLKAINHYKKLLEEYKTIKL